MKPDKISTYHQKFMTQLSETLRPNVLSQSKVIGCQNDKIVMDYRFSVGSANAVPMKKNEADIRPTLEQALKSIKMDLGVTKSSGSNVLLHQEYMGVVIIKDFFDAKCWGPQKARDEADLVIELMRSNMQKIEQHKYFKSGNGLGPLHPDLLHRL